MVKSMITSSIALIIYTSVMFMAYLLSIWYKDLPFSDFAMYFTAGFIAYITKRIMQKKKEYNGH